MTVLVGALLGTLSIAGFNALLALAFTGLGLSLRRAFGLKSLTVEDCFLAFWMGFGLVLLFLIAWNFVFPVGATALAIVLAAGIAGMLGARHALKLALEQSTLPRRSWIGAALFGLWIANLSAGQMVSWDTALYHMQGVKWAASYPVVPGLANVFGPLGFNNSSLLYDAMLDVGPWNGRSWRVSNGVLVWMLGAQIIAGAVRLFDGKQRKPSIDLFPLLLLAAVVNSALHGRVASFSTGVPQALVVLAAAIHGYRLCTEDQRTGRERAYDYFCIAALAAVAVTIKVSAAVFAAAMLAVSCHGLLRRVGAADGSRARALKWTLASVGAIAVAWTARGVVLSGYPLFPSQWLGMSVDWRVPAEHARAEFEFVVHGARATTDDLDYVAGRSEGLGAWFPSWLQSAASDLYSVWVPAALLLLATLAFAASYRRATEAEKATLRPGWWMFAPFAMSLAAWFAVAPMPHYGAPFFWSLAALVGSQALRLRPRSVASTRRWVVAGCLLGASPCFVNPLWSNVGDPSSRSVFAGTLDANFKLPRPGQWYQTARPSVELSEYTTRTGLVLNVPVGPFARAWDAPLPCTPNPAANLRLRVPGHIEKGFAVDGDWQMQDWPEPWRPDLLPAMRERWRRSNRAEAKD